MMVSLLSWGETYSGRSCSAFKDVPLYNLLALNVSMIVETILAYQLPCLEIEALHRLGEDPLIFTKHISI